MNGSLFDEIDLASYHRIASGLAGADITLAVIDEIGDVAWCSDEPDPDLDRLFAQALKAARRAGHATFEEPFCHALGSVHAMVARVLPDPTAEVFGWLLFLFDDTVAGQSRRMMLVADQMAPLLSSALGQVKELNSMALELGDRYEELALLCPAGSGQGGHGECRDELSQQVRLCAQQLDVELCVLWIDASDTWFPAGRAYRHGDEAQRDEILTAARACNDWFHAAHGHLGINLPQDPAWEMLGIHLHYKLLAVPVRDGRRGVAGVLYCLNALDRRDFSNSDRKILEVVADGAAKCLARRQDLLTGLHNRQGFAERFDLVHGCPAGDRPTVCIGLVNLDQFRVVNANYGTTGGDQLLRAVGEVLVEEAPDGVSLARLDADTFAVLFEAAAMADAKTAMHRMVDAVGQIRLEWDRSGLRAHARAGLIALSDCDSDELDDILHRAELALEAARSDHDSPVVVYDEADPRMAGQHQQLHWVARIQQALEKDRFELFCQRIVSLQGTHDHYELLIRMRDEQGGIVRPDLFIGTAERYNLMPALDRWVVAEAARLLAGLSPALKDLCWGINLSGQTVGTPGMLGHIERSLSTGGIAASQVYFELTETAAVENFQTCVGFIRDVQALGCRFALDDFGSGLSSFTYLKRLPVDYLKIDGALIRDMVDDPVDQAMVEAIGDVAHVLGLHTIAEYVEDLATAELLARQGIDYAQGYAYMKPAPLCDEIERLNSGVAARPAGDEAVG